MKKHKILAFVLALAASVALWVYAVTFVNPTDTVSISDIRVRITGESSLEADGLILVNGADEYIDVEIAGRRSVLKELNSSTLEAIADVGNITKPGVYELSWTISPPSSVGSGDIRVVSSNLNRITVTVVEKRERPIPVELRYNKDDLPAGYDLGTIDYTEFITVDGPADEVDRIARAVVQIDLNEQTSKINEPMGYVLEDAEGKTLTPSKHVELSVETVGVMMQILPYKDILLDITLNEGGGLRAQDVTYTLTPSSIRVTATEEILASLPDTLIGTTAIDLASVEGLEPERTKLQFELPEGVVRWGEGSASTITVDVDIEISDDIGILTLPLSDTVLSWINGENGMEYFYAEPDQMIELRGEKTALQQLEAKIKRNEAVISVTIDIAQMDQTQMCVLSVELPRGFEIGLFRQYSARIESRASEAPRSVIGA